MRFLLDHTSRSPYPVQVVRQATAQVIAGRLHPGDRLPSVRQMARQLHISRTTAGRIHEALSDSMVAEVRPRSGLYVATPESAWPDQIREMQAVYEFLKETSERARQMGLDMPRLIKLLGSLEGRDTTAQASGPGVFFPLVATRDFHECVEPSLGDDFPARLLHIPPSGLSADTDPRVFRARFVLSSYFMRVRAKKIAEDLGRPLLYLRYNTRLLNECMDIPTGTRRTLLTRDSSNADSLKVFLAHAYPEVPARRYTVVTVADWLKDPALAHGSEPVWATITVRPFLRGRIHPSRVRLLQPLLADDFVEELRCLALLGYH
jgi:GntR family transcriptional regulator